MKTPGSTSPAFKLLMSLLAIAAFSPIAGAQTTYTKANNTDNLNLTTSWFTGTVPTSTDIALWDSTVTAANSTVLGADLAWKGIQITNPGGNVTIGGNNTLTLGSAGIDASTPASSLSLLSNVTLSANQTWNFNGTVAQTIGNAGQTVTNGGNTLTVNNGTVSMQSALTGTGGLTRTGASGVLTLSGNNTYTGATTVSSGTLQAGVASVAGVSGAFGKNSAVTMANTAGAVLDLNGYNTQIGSLTGGGTTGGNVTLGAATLTVGGDNTTPAPYAGSISGTGGVTKIGTGVFKLTGANTYTGTTTVSGGANSILQIGDSNALGSLSSLSEVTSSDGSFIRFLRNDNFTFANKITGNINLRKYNASSNMTLTGNSTYTGQTFIYAGILNVSSLNSVSGGVASSNLGAPTTSANGTITFGALSGGGQLTYTGAGETTDRIINLGGTSGGAIIDQSGTGNLTLTGNVTSQFAGSKTLTLKGSTTGTGEISGVIANNSTVGQTALDVGFSANASTITLASVDGVSIGAFISGTGITGNTTTITAINTGTKVVTLSANATGTGTAAQLMTVTNVYNPTSVTKAGNGTWTLSGANTYTGNTTVNGGTLRINGSTAAGSAVAVNNTGTLGGTGTIGGVVTVNSGGTLAPGNGAGLLTVGSLVLNAGSTTAFEIAGTTTRGGDYDAINITTASGLALNGNFTIAFTNGSALSNTTDINLFQYTGSYTGNFTSLVSTGFYAGTWTPGGGNFTLSSGGQTLAFSQGTGSLTVVPEPAIWALLAFSLTTVIVLRRRSTKA